MESKGKKSQKSENTGNGLVPLKLEIPCPSEATNVLNETFNKFSSQLIIPDNHLSKLPPSFEYQFEHINMKTIIKSAKFEPEITLERTLMISKLITGKASPPLKRICQKQLRTKRLRLLNISTPI